MAGASEEGIIQIEGQRFAPYIPAEIIDERTEALAEQIVTDYNGRSIHVIHLALGGIFWGTTLTRAIRRCDPDVDMTHDLLRLGSYGQEMTSSGVMRQFGELGRPDLVADNNVILVDEIVDKGLTLSYMLDRLRYGVSQGTSLLHASSLAVATLTDKATVHNGRVRIEYPGFEVPNIWLVGRGMDHKERGRELDTIYYRVGPYEPEPEPFTIPPTTSPFGIRPVA